MKMFFAFLFSLILIHSFAQTNPKLQAKIDQQATEMEAKVIEWRRHFHQYPELSNRETKTGAYIVAHLKSLGISSRYPTLL